MRTRETGQAAFQRPLQLFHRHMSPFEAALETCCGPSSSRRGGTHLASELLLSQLGQRIASSASALPTYFWYTLSSTKEAQIAVGTRERHRGQRISGKSRLEKLSGRWRRHASRLFLAFRGLFRSHFHRFRRALKA